jgi:ubiquinone/menaquinone biosynthesis C-methylase UbiE
MVCHGGFSLDDATRRSWYNPELILQDLRSGMTFADIGCGDGFFSILAAKKVGATGKVFAVDVDPIAVKRLREKAKTEGLSNVFAKVGSAEDTIFCKECADFVFYSMDLHDFNDPSRVLRNAWEMVKSSGSVIDLDWKKNELPSGPPISIKFSQEHAAALITSAGFTVADMRDAGPYHYLIVAKKCVRFAPPSHKAPANHA